MSDILVFADNYDYSRNQVRKGKIKCKHDENVKWNKIIKYKKTNNLDENLKVSLYDMYKKQESKKRYLRLNNMNKARGRQQKNQIILNELGPEVGDVGDLEQKYYDTCGYYWDYDWGCYDNRRRYRYNRIRYQRRKYRNSYYDDDDDYNYNHNQNHNCNHHDSGVNDNYFW